MASLFLYVAHQRKRVGLWEASKETFSLMNLLLNADVFLLAVDCDCKHLMEVWRGENFWSGWLLSKTKLLASTCLEA